MPIYSDDMYVMFSKKSTTPELVEAFNRSLAELRANGVRQQIMSKYPGTDRTIESCSYRAQA